MDGKTIEELHLGDKASMSKTIDEAELSLFADATGDRNPLHFDQAFAEKTVFKGRVVHGMIGACLISTVMATFLPGPGNIYLGQEIRFTAPVRVGDTLQAEVEVVEILREKNIVRLKTVCKNQQDQTVITGIATVMPRKKEKI